MDKRNNRMMWIIGVAVVIIIAVIIAVMMNNTNKTTTTQTTDQTQPAVTPPAADTGAASNVSYNDALKKYGSNRIQFGTTCQATPNTVTYKSGTQVMFDNRSPSVRKIGFNGSIYTIAADGFRVISMTASKYPSTVLVDCDNYQNVATVLIQK